MKRLIFLLTCIMAIGIGGGVRAEITSWVDENGVKHFSDKPAPAGVEYESKTEIITPEWKIKQIEAEEAREREEKERRFRETVYWNPYTRDQSEVAELERETQELEERLWDIQEPLVKSQRWYLWKLKKMQEEKERNWAHDDLVDAIREAQESQRYILRPSESGRRLILEPEDY